ncbi:hypothetical protein LTR37_018447 [Vermiconidia calcicola]|uniref:Uncharacterized protein n=1 Tax=Vermiconidia calcicola TaxID=1690605 RepID=A0ACC3MGZ3_9PEZI|nr:hypothetical protein LTR37_018447 [Vermiconidia calcicola]
MGICSSCLGLNRHPSQDNDETGPLLEEHQAEYGGIGGGDAPQPDEEELRRERETLDQITTEATDNMIDVLHPGTSDSLSQHFAHGGSQRSWQHRDDQTEEGEEDEESAWLQSVQASGTEDIKGLQTGDLTMDVGQLREERSRRL